MASATRSIAAREWVGGEPFLLLLGDHLYRSAIDRPCAQQLIDIFEKHQDQHRQPHGNRRGGDQQLWHGDG